jgi:hypothetical protein
MAELLSKLLKANFFSLKRSKNIVQSAANFIGHFQQQKSKPQLLSSPGILQNDARISSHSNKKVKWYEGKSLKELPSYIFWPVEKRYGKVLWWGNGKDGLYFIEKGRGYVYAGDEAWFVPANEEDYLCYTQNNCE